jgi:hypothetical protein
VHDGMSNFCFGEGEKVFFFFFLFFFGWSTEPYGIRNFCFIPKGVKLAPWSRSTNERETFC